MLSEMPENKGKYVIVAHVYKYRGMLQGTESMQNTDQGKQEFNIYVLYDPTDGRSCLFKTFQVSTWTVANPHKCMQGRNNLSRAKCNPFFKKKD